MASSNIGKGFEQKWKDNERFYPELCEMQSLI